LFADDSVTMQKVMQLTLENEDFDLRVAGDGNTAYDMALEELPDIVIADVSMPGQDGFQLCENLKKNPRTGAIPVILISGEMEHYDQKRGRAAGAVAQVTKPFKSGEFIAMIRKYAAKEGAVSASAIDEDMADAEQPTGAPGADGRKPQLLELVTRAKGQASVEEDEELEIVEEDLDDLEDELENMEEGLEEDLLTSDELKEMEDDEAAPPAPVMAGTMDMEAEMENVFSALGNVPADKTPSVFDMPDADEKARVVDEVGLGTGQHGTGEEPTEKSETEQIFADVFNPVERGNSKEEAPLIAEGEVVTAVELEIGEEELWSKTLDDINHEVDKAVQEEVQPESPVAAGGFAPPNASPPIARRLAAGEMEEIFRESVERAVSEFIAARAADIFREEMSRAIDRHVKEIFESQMEKAFREEISRMIAASFQKAMPRMLGIIEKITVQITPKVAQHMIKIAIERIKKGDIN
jgi:CheY-like chemotaxis protein